MLRDMRTYSVCTSISDKKQLAKQSKRNNLELVKQVLELFWLKSGWGHGVITISGYADTPLQLLEAMAPHRIKIFCTKRLLETRQKLNPENFVWRGLVSKN